MISVSEAKRTIQENVTPLGEIILPLRQAFGKTLAEDIYSNIDMPAYPQSSMDGYAFIFSEWQQIGTLQVMGEMAAGAQNELQLQPNQAARIFTGAPIPSNADTVVMQEKVIRVGDTITIQDEQLQEGSNVRPIGSEIRKGELALEKGNTLSPSAIGFLAGIGIAEVKIYRQPTVSIIVTGKELQQIGKPLAFGQVYESNSLTLTAALEKFGATDITVYHADDYLDVLTETLQEALSKSDMVLLTGGISVGDYDFVLQACNNCGVQQHFHKIKQKPGKPLYFGKLHEKVVFGLPGNPSSVLTCFYQYVLPAIGLLANTSLTLQNVHAPLAKAVRKPAGITQFLKGYYDGFEASALGAQESYRMSSFAKANCLIQLNEGITEVKEKETVLVYLLPQ